MIGYKDYLDWIKKKYGDEFLTEISAKRLPDKESSRIVQIMQEKCPYRILEIGRFKGFSLGLFKYFSPIGWLVSIDPVLHIEAVQIASNFDEVILLTGTTDDIQQIDLTHKFDFVLIDGDHTYDSAKKDWENVKNYLNTGACVFFDNLRHPEGCGRVYDEIDIGVKERVSAEAGIIWM